MDETGEGWRGNPYNPINSINIDNNPHNNPNTNQNNPNDVMLGRDPLAAHSAVPAVNSSPIPQTGGLAYGMEHTKGGLGDRGAAFYEF